MKRLAIAVLAVTAASGVTADVYQWKDDQGRTVLSDQPPPGRTKPVRTYDAPPAPAAGPEKTMAEKELEFRKRRQAEKERADKEQADRERGEQCERARRSLAILESGDPLVVRDEGGERRAMDDETRAKEIANARQNIERSCR